MVIIGDANGAILAYDALCLNHTLDDTTSLYGDGKLFEEFCSLELHLLFGKDNSTPRTPGVLKRAMTTGPPDTSDTTSLQSSTRQTPQRMMTIDTSEMGDSM